MTNEQLIALALDHGNAQNNWRGNVEYVFSTYGLKTLVAALASQAAEPAATQVPRDEFRDYLTHRLTRVLVDCKDMGKEYADLHCDFLQSVLAALRPPAPPAGISPAPLAGEWRTIETAPKDGRRFLAFYKGNVGFFQWQDFGDECPVGWRDSFINVYREGTGPTHWMPVPAAPSGLVSGEGEGA